MEIKEREITVKLKWTLDETKVYFVNKGIPLVGSFILKDIYLINGNTDVGKSSNLEVLSKSLVIRERTGSFPDKVLMYKDKKYDEKENILDSKKYLCPLVDTDKMYYLLLAAGYKECFRYEQECLEYKYKDLNIFVEYIPELGLFLELENNNIEVEELIEDLKELNIPYYEDDYFVKKASLMMDAIRG